MPPETQHPRVNVIEVTFEDGSSDTIQLYPADGKSLPLFGWTRRRNGQKKKTGAYTMPGIATYLYEIAHRGEGVDYHGLARLGIALQKAYALCRDSNKAT